jgi:hypothetical protein
MERRLMSFDIDEVTEKKLCEVASATGINSNAPTIRWLINQAWQKMKSEQSTIQMSAESIQQRILGQAEPFQTPEIQTEEIQQIHK